MILLLGWGFFLGFTGYLPLGNINLTVVGLSLDNSVRRLWGFITLAAIMEFVYCVGCLLGMNLLLAQPQWVVILKWASVFIFFGLGILTFLHNENDTGGASDAGLSRGVFAVFINPLQIPFWLVWGVYLTQNKWLSSALSVIMLFALVTSLGTVTILWLYAVGGKKLVEKLKVERKLLDRIIGVLLISLSFIELYKILYP